MASLAKLYEPSSPSQLYYTIFLGFDSGKCHYTDFWFLYTAGPVQSVFVYQNNCTLQMNESSDTTKLSLTQVP